MWTYDAQKDICKQFDYSGCHGNANRFDSKAECEKGCVRGTLDVEGISSDFPGQLLFIPRRRAKSLSVKVSPGDLGMQHTQERWLTVVF